MGLLHPRSAEAGSDGAAIARDYASIPDDPWAVCHGIRAMGRTFTVTGGRRAVDYLLETHLALVPTPGGRTALAFPEDVEIHPNMFLKTMLEAGVPLDHPFTHEGRRRTLREVLDGARTLFRPTQVAGSPNMLPWSMIAFARTTTPLKARWTNGWGEAVDFDPIVEAALGLMEQGSLPLMHAMREGQPLASKAPVHAFTCGGTHMLYALLTTMDAGYRGRDRLERTRRQVDLVLWRMTADIELMGRFFDERPPPVGRHWFELDAKLKLYGHAEECLALATRHGLVTLTAAQQAQRREATVALRGMLEEMEKKTLREARALHSELYRQLVGDACHARHGLTFA